MEILREHVIVKVPSVFIEETMFKGVNGKAIMLNPTYRPARHTRYYGIVTSIPNELYEYPLIGPSVSGPAYHDYPEFSYRANGRKTNRDIELEVEVGDKIYFNYNCLLPDMADQKWNKMFLYSEKDETGMMFHYFRIKYELIYAAVRYEPLNTVTPAFDWHQEANLKPHIEGNFYYTDNRGLDQVYRKRVVMIGSHVFVEPDKETWEEISIPIPEMIGGKPVLNADGSVRLKPKDQWLVTKPVPEDKYLQGWVRFCGSPLKGHREFVRPGMYVYFQRFANTRIVFEGTPYFRMKQVHIIGMGFKQKR